MSSLESVTRERNDIDTRVDPNMLRRKQMVDRHWHRYRDVMQQTGFANTRGVRETAEWIQKTELSEVGDNSIVYREEFFEGHGRTIIEEGPRIYKKFFTELERGKSSISKNSAKRWEERFKNENTSFEEKRYWINKQMPAFVDSWISIAKDRDTIVKNPALDEAIALDPELNILKNKEAFLDLPFEKKAGYIAQAKAAMSANKKEQRELYNTAKDKLAAAASEHILGSGKAGIWLQRIFKSKANPKKIHAFVNGEGPNSLDGLIGNWRVVKQRYDIAYQNIQKKTDENAVRGLHLLSESKFLSLHYNERLRYVGEIEQRLHDSPNAQKELPVFLEIRHAIDVQDYEEAEMLLQKTDGTSLTPKNRERLRSMEKYVRQFKPKKGPSGKEDEARSAKEKIDQLIQRVPFSLRPMIIRLLRSVQPNRAIHQFRWIVYNNKWCRTHGYLDEKKAMEGASDDKKEMTKFRSEQGLDTGRDDVIDSDTAHRQYFRKKEFADHKATYLHVNTNEGALSALAEWMEREQDPKVLYWTTFCGHEDGLPKSNNWHNDLFEILSEMRSCTRTIDNAGYRYHSASEPLQQKQ